jgi:hypothetical protein
MNTAIIATSSPIKVYSENQPDCIRTETNLTYNIVHNVCTGEVTTVPSGTVDITFTLFLLAIPLAIVLFFLRVIFD